jgi:hypothetical protein
MEGMCPTADQVNKLRKLKVYCMGTQTILNDTIAKERAEGCIEVTTYILINSLAT